jgi:hypothetical protein
MHCENWDEMLIDRVAGELREEDAVLLEQHLAECRDCLEEHLRLSEMLASQRESEAWIASPELLPRLLASMREPTPRPSVSRRASRFAGIRTGTSPAWTIRSIFLRPLPTYAAAGLIVFAVGAGIFIGRSAGPEGPSAWRDGVSPGDLPENRLLEEAARPTSSPPRDQAQQRLADSSLRGGSKAMMAFVAVQPDAMGLPTPVRRDSL